MPPYSSLPSELLWATVGAASTLRASRKPSAEASKARTVATPGIADAHEIRPAST